MLRSMIIWITFHCNYKCPYCTTRFRVNSMPQTSPPDRWIQALNRFQDLKIDFTGGEPLLYPGFPELVQGLDPSHSLAVTTNLSQGDPAAPWWQRLNCITLSFHPSQMDRDGELDFITRAGQLRYNYSGSMTVNFVAAKIQMHRIPELKPVFEDMGIHFHVDPDADALYTAQELAFLKPWVGSDRLIGQQKHDFFSRPRLCSAGSSYVQIFPEGTMIPCFYFPAMGSFFDDPPPLDQDLRECDAQGCGGCDWDANFIYDLAGNLVKPGK